MSAAGLSIGRVDIVSLFSRFVQVARLKACRRGWGQTGVWVLWGRVEICGTIGMVRPGRVENITAEYFLNSFSQLPPALQV